ncbi:MAG TPA: hypothetical protein VFZ53_11190 [Polyangiaceae bacterium]
MVVESRGETFLLVTGGRGRMSALDFKTGDEAWGVALPVGKGLLPFTVATPVRVGQHVFIAYGGFDPSVSKDPLANVPSRQEHLVAALDLEARQLDRAFAPVTLAGGLPATLGEGMVTFNPPTQLVRGALQHMPGDGTLGHVYIAAGNKGDIQPWHGWVFEIDLERWRADGPGAAISARLLTTPELDCGEEGTSGMHDMVCGGGVWTPAGPQIFETPDGHEVLVPTGNGHLDLTKGMYANGLLRMGRGLRFDPGCSERACADFDPINPSRECLESCSDLFVPRLAGGDPPLRPEGGDCDGLSFYECYAELDYDFGANAPARVELPSGRVVYVQPSKDGHVYVIDAAHMGRMLARQKVTDPCGTKQDPCQRSWTGMIVTQPNVLEVDDGLLVLVPTFMYDATHPAGVVALAIEEDGDDVRLRPVWRAPRLGSEEARRRFRSHPSRIAISGEGAERIAWVVDVFGFRNGKDVAAERRKSGKGDLLGIRVRDGEIVERIQLRGRGERYLIPTVRDGMIYVGSCGSDAGPSFVEGYRLPDRD